jgi:hypothetical protein
MQVPNCSLWVIFFLLIQTEPGRFLQEDSVLL